MSGWIKLHRELMKWEWYTDANTCHLFIHLLLSANHQTTRWRGHTIEAGQLLTGRIKLAQETGLSERNVRTSLEKLKSTKEVTSKTYNKYSIITITNWKVYQQIDQQPTSEVSSNRPATDQQPTTSNNIKNEKNIINQESGDFFNFDIERLLDDKARLAAKQKAPGWDLYYLMPIFNEWMKDKRPPDNPVGAFINWCGTYTKGKEL